ncbi:MAG: hypothetical protein WCJ51_04295 [Candidatus Moraniibacteriota bacterium]
MTKENVIKIGVIIVAVLVTGTVVGFLLTQRVQKSTGKVTSFSGAVSNLQEKIAEKTNQASAGLVPRGYTDENVQWYDAPRKVMGIQLFKDGNDLYQVWETGKIKTGEFSGSRLLLVVMNPQGPANVAQIYRFIQKTGEEQLYFLKEYSTDDIFNSYDGALLERVFPYKNYAYDVHISSLEYPGTMIAPSGQQLKKEDSFPFAGIRELNGDTKDAYFNGIFFKTDMLKFAFTDPVYGNIYTTDASKVNDGNINTAFAENGFYVKAPDGTFRAYSSVIDLGGDVPKINWNDGTQNSSKYSYKTESGCGASNYVNDVSNIISGDKLVQVGTAENGELIYGYKDLNEQALKDFYAEYKKLSSDENMFARYYPDDKAVQLTYDQFLQTHPFFFWKDSFGRIIQFINLHYIYSGGCGKPVIYLYPEQKEKISVQVTPTAGMSVSIPEYNGGWNVVADSQSNIFNLADEKTYPYLFWEGSGNSIYHMPERGFVVTMENLNSFFDEKLSQEGLIQKEINDFKEFWIPKMLTEKKPYYFVTFVDRATIDKLAPLEINPKPDTTIRVLMDFKGLDNSIPVQGFNIKTPQRIGFTAVEWGGVLK